MYNGELDGITSAIEYASNIASPGDYFDIYSDNQAGIYRLSKTSDNPGQASQIRCIEASNRIVAQGATITINWVPGHEDILGNELADSLAKEATKQPFLEPTYTSFALLGLKIKGLQAQEWALVVQEYKKKTLVKYANPATYSNIYSWRLSRKLIIPQGTKRLVASAFYQLKIGHGYLKQYLYRIKRASNNKCRCGQPETTKHLLLSCKDFKPERRSVEVGLGTRALNLPLLLHTTIGIEKALEYIRDTRICSRPWHLERNPEEVEDAEE